MQRIRTHWLFLALLAAVLATGCGFHLRGQVKLPYGTVYVNGAQGSGLVLALQRVIRNSDAAKLVTRADQADGVVDILSEQNSKVILSLSGIGKVREYQLQYHVKYAVRDAKGKPIVPTTEIGLSRDMTYSDTQVLAKAEEEKLLYRDMQNDAAQQILRRMAAVK